MSEEKFQIILSDARELLEKDSVFRLSFPYDYTINRQWRDVSMSALIRIVIGQQISSKVAQALWAKMTADMNPENPQDILEASEEKMRSYGLSRQKIGYVRGLALAVQSGEIDIQLWPTLSSDIVLKQIVSLKGFGVWSAQMFMMFHLGDRNIWPAGDLGIQIGLQEYFKLDDRPNEKQAKEYQKHFEGVESGASLLLWDLKDNKTEMAKAFKP